MMRGWINTGTPTRRTVRRDLSPGAISWGAGWRLAPDWSWAVRSFPFCLPVSGPGNLPRLRRLPPVPRLRPNQSSSTPSTAKLVVVRGSIPSALVEAALAGLGGLERFVKPGADVIVHPNICVAYRSFEYAATTNPEVVGTLVRLCLKAGAKRVRVMDSPFGGTSEEAYEISGIGPAVRAAGGEMEFMHPAKFAEAEIPDGRDITSWPIYQDALSADVLINVPIAKHHNLGRLSLGMKNLMGLIQDRGEFHANLGQRIADLASRLRPMLTLVDAVRILRNHGPTGGNLDDVQQTNTVIASTDFVAADAYAATLFGLTGPDIPYLRAGGAMGLGQLDLARVPTEEIALSP